MQDIRSILVLHSGALGDFVLTLHVVEAVRRCTGAARVEVVARSPLAPWVARRGLVQAAHHPDAFALHRLYASAARPDDGLGKLLSGFDLTISFLALAQDAISENLRRHSSGRFLAIDPRPRGESGASARHITDQWCGDLRPQGLERCGSPVSAGSRLLPLEVNEQDRVAAQGRLGSVGRVVFIHPGSGGRGKCAPLEWLEELAHVLRRHELSVRWMIGEAELERDGPGIRERLARVAPVVYEPDVGVAADLLAGAQVYVGNDAGMTHLAAARGLHTVALFGSTDPVVWQPLGRAIICYPFPVKSDAGMAGLVRLISDAGNDDAQRHGLAVRADRQPGTRDTLHD